MLRHLASKAARCSGSAITALTSDAQRQLLVQHAPAALQVLRHHPSGWQPTSIPMWSHFSSDATAKTGGDAEKPAEAVGPTAEGEAASPAAEAGAQSQGVESGEAPSLDVLQSLIDEQEALISEQSQKVDELKEQLLRSLADMENLRDRTRREVDNAKNFGVQGFVKKVLDVGDNLQRAAAAVPAGVISGQETVDAERALGLLKGLLEGVELTEKMLQQVLGQVGVARYPSLGEAFDPNRHNAMFEVPDPSKAPGTVAVVVKEGYTILDRVLRPADVGVTRAP